MRSLPSTDNSEIAARSDLHAGLAELRREVEVMGRELRAEIKSETAEINDSREGLLTHAGVDDVLGDGEARRRRW